MNKHRNGDILFYSYKLFDRYPHLTNVVSTRGNGRSKVPFESLNLAFHVGDDAGAVLENRATFCQSLAIESEAPTFAEQVHGSEVAVIKASDRGRGAVTLDDALPGVDGLVTDAADVPLVVLVADCVAVSLYDPDKHAIGMVHAGWKGTLARIATKAVERMVEVFGSDPARLVAGISPSIGKGHYETDHDVLDAFAEEFGRRDAREFVQEDMDGTCYLDLWTANTWQLREAGVLGTHIAVSEMCTACHLSEFYSHRHEGGNTGRFAALIMLHARTTRQYS